MGTGVFIGEDMISKYGVVEVVVMSTINPRRERSHGYNNWNDFYPPAGESFIIQDILDARATAKSNGKMAVNADGKMDEGDDMRHILWDLKDGFTKLKDPDDIELFRDTPGTYLGIKKHQGTQKYDNSIDPTLPLASKPGFKSHDLPLNQILYGPPGTGKTYETKSLAVEIITGEKLSNRDELNSHYNSLVEDGRIQFITFHQSYGYEDFVEGIKPKLDKPEGGDVEYEIKDGIFKKMCRESTNKKYLNTTIYSDESHVQQEEKLNPKKNEGHKILQLDSPSCTEAFNFGKKYQGRNVWQLRMTHGSMNENSISVDGFNWFDKYNLDDEVKNSQGKASEFSKMLDRNILEQINKGIDPNDMIRSDAAINRTMRFCLKMRKGDLVMVHKRPNSSKLESKELNQILAVAEVIGDYKYEEGERYAHTRAVKFLWCKRDDELPINISDINNGKILSDTTICGAKNINPELLIKKVNERIGHIQENEVTQDEELVVSNSDHRPPQNRFVLIIDEINRGNISKILGELITLLEEDKRLGNEETLEVTLPYSGDKFSIPNNLYIIGTMNTADRSIAFLDTALRRRFDFREMMPDSKILEDKIFEGVNLQQLLDAINFKIREELDRDHQIGHSYLINVKSISDLARAFKNKICPLLDEYFHDRREKINSILNNSNLITNEDKNNWDWANDEAFQNPENYKAVYKANSGD